MNQTIPVSLTGAEYTWPLTIIERTGKDITGAAVSLALGTDADPGTWHAPGTDTAPADNQRTVQMLVDASYPVGSYWLWTKVVDTPETVIRRQVQVVLT